MLMFRSIIVRLMNYCFHHGLGTVSLGMIDARTHCRSILTLTEELGANLVTIRHLMFCVPLFNSTLGLSRFGKVVCR